MSFWRQRESASSHEEVENPCPICVELNRRPGHNTKVEPITHGAGGPDGSWGACYEHYKVVNAIYWLVLREDKAFDFSLPIRSKDIATQQCRCSRCLEVNENKVTIMTICSECGSKRCPHAMDHRDPCSEYQD